MGGCYCCHGWCRGSCVHGCPCLCSLMCHWNARQQWGWVRAALHSLVSSWDVGPRWAPAPGILQGNHVMGELQQRRGVCCLCPASAHAQPLPVPVLLTASSTVPLAMCCSAFCALTDVLSKSTLNYGNNSVIHLPDAFSVLQLAGMAGELWW